MQEIPAHYQQACKKPREYPDIVNVHIKKILKISRNIQRAYAARPTGLQGMPSTWLYLAFHRAAGRKPLPVKNSV